MSKSSIVRKITTGYQITLPPHFRSNHHLHVGSILSITDEGDRLIIEPYINKSKALSKLKELFTQPKLNDFKDMDEEEISSLVDHEIKEARKS